MSSRQGMSLAQNQTVNSEFEKKLIELWAQAAKDAADPRDHGFSNTYLHGDQIWDEYGKTFSKIVLPHRELWQIARNMYRLLLDREWERFFGATEEISKQNHLCQIARLTRDYLSAARKARMGENDCREQFQQSLQKKTESFRANLCDVLEKTEAWERSGQCKNMMKVVVEYVRPLADATARKARCETVYQMVCEYLRSSLNFEESARIALYNLDDADKRDVRRRLQESKQNLAGHDLASILDKMKQDMSTLHYLIDLLESVP